MQVTHGTFILCQKIKTKDALVIRIYDRKIIIHYEGSFVFNPMAAITVEAHKKLI